MFTTRFVRDALERAVKSAAQFAIAAFGAGVTNILDVSAVDVAGAAGAGLVLSLLTSLASSGVGNSESASVVKPEVVVEEGPEVQ